MGGAALPLIAAVAGGLGTTLVARAMTPGAPKPPATPPSPVSPDQEGAVMEAERRRMAADQRRKRGRASTILGSGLPGGIGAANQAATVRKTLLGE